MKKIYSLFLIPFLFGFVTPEPPKIEDKATYEYLRTIRNNLNKPQVVTVNPSGVTLGSYGDILIYNDSGTFYIMVNVSSPNGKTWKGVVLGTI